MEFTGGTTVTASMGILEQIHMISNLSRHGNSYGLFGYVGEKAHKIVVVSRNEVQWLDTGQRVLYFRTTSLYRDVETRIIDTDDCGWGVIPALKKLHNIAVLLHTSVLLYQSWVSAIGVALGIDNITRWNSWFNIIDVALQRRSAIVIWLMDNINKIGDNHLEKDDWGLLQKTHEFLQPFKQGTLLTEKNLSNLSDAVMVLDILLVHCRRFRVRLGACV